MTTNTISMSGIDEIGTLFNSRRRAILVQTFEEERFIEDLKLLIESKGYEGYEWTVTSGAQDVFTGEQTFKMYDPIKLMDTIKKHDKQAAFIIKDFHDIWSNYQAKRALRDVLEKQDKTYKPLILISPQTNIPQELEKLITVVTYDLPNRDQVAEQLEGMDQYLRSKDLEVPQGREREAIIHGLTGMTHSEIINVMKKSVVKNHKIDLAEIVAEKEQVIKKTGLLEYVTKLGNMEDVGGMDTFKDWLEDAKFAFDPEARKYHIDAVRGVVAAGIPGTGKSLLSKAVAQLWNLPLLKMNMSQIMDSRVGQSEKNIDRALKLAEAISPCVLWIDEIEKGLAGISSSDRSDSGTLSRVVQSLLTWLSDKQAPVFVMATANDITKLPPELTRAGRFDEIFFVSLPGLEEREDILKIHLRKRGYTFTSTDGEVTDLGQFSPSDIYGLAQQAEDFTGAELEQVVAEAGRRAYAAFVKKQREDSHMTFADISDQIHQMIPMSQRDPALISGLRDWAKGAAKCASSNEHQLLHGDGKAKAKLHTISGLDLDLND